ncbi:MAG: molybdopterin molybdotransferase MoeA [Hyphomicrobiaceae bacterium]|nr:molybdopterin molybdotransferase MoeA [Hyphomicrobiaceae bacterium]
MSAPANPLSVSQAIERILAGAVPLATEAVGLFEADGRILAEDVVARRTQPPFDVSAMDGFAVRAKDVTALPATLDIIGQSAAGHGYHDPVQTGQAVRIFTGAPIPPGADAIVIQEDTEHDESRVTVISGQSDPGHIRPRGFDFRDGQTLVTQGRRLTARDVTLAAAAGYDRLVVRRRPKVALLATGDELVLPGESVGPDQIVCSNPFGIAAIVARAGGEPQFLGIARDNRQDLAAKCNQARSADILVTIGGASVGDHDLVGPVLGDMGMALDFWKIAMRPGKPLMSGRLGDLHVLGVPGNPVSSMVCARIFLVPLIEALLGLPHQDNTTEPARAGRDLGANGPRQHYMRAVLSRTTDGSLEATPVASQDSSLLVHLATADALIVRAPHDRAIAKGEPVEIIRLDF